MTSLVLGLAGAVVGFYLGGPTGAALGWSLGSAVGNYIDPAKTTGPRLSDLHLQGSSYGAPIPIVYGTIRIAGNVIWQTDLIEHSHEEGGKGGPTQETFTYTASYAIQICEGPILGVFKMWADGRLVYYTDEFGAIHGGDIPFTLYLGDEEQGADPTMEAVLGAGNVPGYRGTAYIVFTDHDLSDFGNRIPVWTFEVSTGAGDIPWRVSTFVPENLHGAANILGYEMNDGVLSVGEYTAGDGVMEWVTKNYDVEGNFIDETEAAIYPNILGAGNTEIPLQAQNSASLSAAQIPHQGNDNPNASGWYVNGRIAAQPIHPPVGTDSRYSVDTPPFVWDDNVYATGGLGQAWVARWPMTDGIPSSFPDAYYSLSASLPGADYECTVDEQGQVWVSYSAPSILDVELWKFDAELNLLHHWLSTDPLPPDFDGIKRFVVFNDHILFSGTLGGGGAAVGICYAINDDDTFTLVGTTPLQNTNLISLGSGLALGADGIVSINPPPVGTRLSQIVQDLSERCGLSANQVNVAQLTDTVAGYVIGSQMTGRAAIETLMPVYFFDAVESDSIIKFVKRGGDSVATITDDELAATEYGSDLPAVLPMVRTDPSQLPAVVNVIYLNPDADYQNNTQIARRRTGGSRDPMTTQIPVVLTDANAKAIVDAWIFHFWDERNRKSFSTTRKYSWLEPCDVVTIRGEDLRLTQKLQGAAGVIHFEALTSRSAVFLQAPIPGTGSGFTTPVIHSPQDTQLLLLDLPLLSDGDSAGYYAAMAGASRAAWRGATLYKSNDGGTTYTSIGSSSTPDVIGTCSNVLGDFLGGDIFDELNTLTVVIGNGGGELSSVTEAAVLNGENQGLAGGEVFNYRDADLIDVDTYRLSGLLRGRRGTEWAIGTHSASERFVKLPVGLNIASSELNVSRLYKAVTRGNTLASAAAVTFANTGTAVRPYSVVHGGGGFNGAGDCIINWVRRTRIGGDWVGYVEIPLSEESESYRVEIWDSSAYATIVRTITGLTTPTCTYTAAEQTADFGSAQSEVFAKVFQNGRFLPSRGVRIRIPNNTLTWTSDLEPLPGPIPVPPSSGGGAATIPMTWGLPGVTTQAYSRDYGGFAPDQAISISFTTPSGTSVPGTNGRLSLVEFDSPTTPRTCCLSTVNGDFETGIAGYPTSKIADDVAPRIFFTVGATAPAGMVRLESSTTYYWNVRNGAASSDTCNIQVTLQQPSGL